MEKENTIIEELISRSIDTIYPSRDQLKRALESGKKLRVYMGIDPTSTYVHLGHSTNYFVLKRFHELGHKIIVLIGDFTAMIGDPSDKSALRVRLSKEQVQENLKTFKEQIGRILDFNSIENPIEIRYNSEWLGKLNFGEVVDLASNFTVQQMIDRDNFQRRIKEKKPLYLHEFLYPLMQGYDSVALDVDVEIGGRDQTFNMLAGRTLVRALQKKEKLVVVTTLLENPVTGEKLMSKSLGTGIGLNETANEMFGKTMALPDEAIIQVFIDCTTLPLTEVEKMKHGLKSGMNPRDIKMQLAYEIVKFYHDIASADKAKEHFVNTFQKKEVPEDIKEVKVSSEKLLDVLIESGLVPSASEGKRLIEQEGIKVDGVTAENESQRVESGSLIQKGKREFRRIV